MIITTVDHTTRDRLFIITSKELHYKGQISITTGELHYKGQTSITTMESYKRDVQKDKLWECHMQHGRLSDVSMHHSH